MAIKTFRILTLDRAGRVRGGRKASGKMLRLLCLINVMNVREVSLGIEALLSIKKSTRVRNPFSVIHVEKASREFHSLFTIKEAILGKIFYLHDPCLICQS